MPSKYEQLINRAAQRYGISPQYLTKLIRYESNENPNAVSSTGATGLTQFTKGTAKQYGLTNRADPASNIDAAARLALDNQRALSKVLGRTPTDSELYLGHLQGAGGASKGFRNPSGRAVDVFGTQAVKANLPASQRGRMNEFTAEQFQNLHKSNFDRKGKSIDIGTSPTLNQLQPAKSKSEMMINTPSGNIPLSQLTPTESTDMARHKYPGYNEAIKQSLTGNTENVEVVPSSFIPPDTDLKGRVKVAGIVPPGLTKGAAETRASANAKVQPKGGMPPPKSTVPDAETQIGRKDIPTTDEEKSAISAWNEAHEKWLNGDGPNPGPPPTGKPEPRIRDATDPRGAADPRTGTSQQRTDPNISAQGDPASNASISARIRGTARQGDITGPTATAGAGAVVAGTMASTPRPVAAPKPPDTIPGNPPGDTLTIEHLIAQGIPTIKEAMKNPQTAGAVKTAVKGLITTRAAQDSMRADVIKDPTYYQRTASQRTPSGSPADPSDPMYERRMMDAVARDQNNSMRGSSTRGMPSANRGVVPTQPQQQQVAAPQQQPAIPTSATKAPSPEEQIVQQVLAGENSGSQAQRFPPSGPPPPQQPPGFAQSVQPPMYGSMVPPPRPMQDQAGFYPQQPPTQQQSFDPAMMQLMQFFGGGGGATE